MLHFNITTIWIFISCWICVSSHVLLTLFSHSLHIPYRINCCFSDILVIFYWLLKQYMFIWKIKKSVRSERRKQNSTVMSSLGELYSFVLTRVISVWVVQRQGWCYYIKYQQKVHKQCHNSIQFSGSFCWFAFFL